MRAWSAVASTRMNANIFVMNGCAVGIYRRARRCKIDIAICERMVITLNFESHPQPRRCFRRRDIDHREDAARLELSIMMRGSGDCATNAELAESAACLCLNGYGCQTSTVVFIATVASFAWLAPVRPYTHSRRLYIALQHKAARWWHRSNSLARSVHPDMGGDFICFYTCIEAQHTARQPRRRLTA